MQALKSILRLYGLLRAVPFLLRHAILARVLGPDRALSGESERIARLGGLAGQYVRAAFYRRTLGCVGRDVHFGYMSLLSKCDARVEDRVYIGRFCVIGLAEIGEGAMLADAVQVLSGRHQHGRPGESAGPMRENQLNFTRVRIGAGAWIGAGAIVMADVGENAVVGAGAVVIDPVPAGACVGGVPARPLSARAA